MRKLLVILSVLLSTQINAQTTDTTIVLDDVVISATRSEISLEDSPVPTEVIGKKEIEKLNLITMEDLLQAKGIQVAPMKSGGFQLRGLSSEYVLVMIDGVPIAGRESGALDLSNINLSNVERVEIVKGSMSSLWGNHAIGGVVNIITQKGGEPSLQLNTQYGTNNTSLVGLNGGFTKGKFSNLSKVSFQNSDGFDADPNTYGQTVLPNSLVNISNTSRYSDGVNTFSLGATYFKKDSKGETVTETNTAGQLIETTEENTSDNLILDLNYKRVFGKYVSEIKLSNSSFSNSNKASFEFFGQDVERLDESTQNIFQPEMINSYNWNEKNQTTLGFGMRDYTYDTERYGGERELGSSFGYLQHYLNLGKLNIVAGGRFDKYNEFGSNFSPKVSAKYDIGKFSFNASVGSGFRVPDFRTMYLTLGGYTQGFYVLGSELIEDEINFYQANNQIAFLTYDISDINSLSSETSVSYDFGVSYKLNQRSKIGLNIFQTNTTDLIESVFVGSFINQTALFGYTNINDATFTGVEFEALYQKGGLRIDGSYQYLETEALKADGTEFFLGERPKHLTNLSASYTTSKKYSFVLNGTHKSEYFFRDIDGGGTQDENEFIPQHTLLNGIVTKQFGKYTIGVGSNNILNFTNSEFLKFQNGRTVFGKLTYKF
jgi:outer membrane receptor for ferrienterochelin and colicins